MHKNKNWNWFEESITYGNAFLSWSLFCAYKLLGKECYVETAKESMDFLESNGWLVKGMHVSDYNEQPIEACEMIYAYMEYY